MNRLTIAYGRRTRDASGKVTGHVRESLDIVHPDDHKGERNSRRNFDSFREIGAMFRSSPDYFDITYTKTEAAI